MKKFINNVLKFNILFIGIIFLALASKLVYEKTTIDFKLPSNKTVLAIGNSHIECAINDSIISNLFNFSESADTYIYSYLKIKKILENNPQIKTVVVNYGVESLSKSKDEWIFGFDHLKNFLPKYFSILDLDEFYLLVSSNSYGVIMSIPKTILKFNNDLEDLGGYFSLDRIKLDEDKKKFLTKKLNRVDYNSEFQIKYLLKIYNLLLSKNIKMILLSTPVHPLIEKSLNNYMDNYLDFAAEKLPEAHLINHSIFSIPEEGYGDLSHLNYKGAKIYSEYLRDEKVFDTVK